MASFLDNSDDIILDAVLTDYGRQLLAKGDGSFSIVKFAFGDDEIDYSLWDTGSVTSLKDAKIMATPILESFTNNAASMKNKLLTIGVENLLYLPVLKLNTNSAYSPTRNFNNVFNGFAVPIDRTATKETTTALSSSTGVLTTNQLITIDQGLDSSNLDSRKSLKDVQPELYEKEYNIVIDNRLGFIASDFNSTTPLSPVSIDDDNMATYKVSDTTAGGFVSQVDATDTANNIIAGTQGSRLRFTIKPNNNIVNSDALLNRLGETVELVSANPAKNFLTVRTSVTITGVTTGYSLNIPVVFTRYTGT